MTESSNTPPAVDVRGLTKHFKDFWLRPRVQAVSDLSLTIQPGEVFGLLGPNGSGKSTTIKMILGLLHPTSGSIRVLGQAPRDVKSKARIGYLPEESYLYPYLSAKETLSFYGRLFDIEPKQCAQRIDQLLEMVGLPHTGRRAVGEFSKGMARRVGLAQALINDPDLIILDEPTSGLDPIGTLQVKNLIKELAARGKTVLLSSHLLGDVEDVCDRVAILYGGKLRATGTMDELLQQEDQIRIAMPSVAPAVLDEILGTLRDKAGVENAEISHPRMDLETYFQQVVQEARLQGDDAGGSRGTAAVADYLSQHDDQPSAPKADVLAALQTPAATPAQTEATPAESPADADASPEPADLRDAEDRLKNLLRDAQPAPEDDTGA